MFDWMLRRGPQKAEVEVKSSAAGRVAALGGAGRVVWSPRDVASLTKAGFTGNPVGCAAALASLDLLESKECTRQRQHVEQMHSTFLQDIATHKMVREVRQQGTILAVEFHTPEQTGYFNSLRDQLYDFFMERGVLLRPLGNVIYIIPPYCITSEELTTVYEAIRAALDFFSK